MYRLNLFSDEKFKDMIAKANGLEANVFKRLHISMVESTQHVRSQSLRSGKIPYKTGNLRRSITTKVHGTTVNTLEGLVGTDVPYAAIHEYGGTFTRHSAFGKATQPYQVTYKERRYLRDPMEESQRKINQIFQRNMFKAIDFSTIDI